MIGSALAANAFLSGEGTESAGEKCYVVLCDTVIDFIMLFLSK